MRHPRGLDPVVLGPVRLGDHTVRLRPPRLDDHAEWRRLRLRDEARIAPYWATSELDWSARHTEVVWIRELLDRRADARAGRGLSFVIEVDGRLAGQCGLSDIDPDRHAGELGVWTDHAVAGHGVAQLALAMVSDDAFDRLGLGRLTAPITPANTGIARALAHNGMAREATMACYMDVGGARRTHELWSVLREPGRRGAHVRRVLAEHGAPDPVPVPVSVVALPAVHPDSVGAVAGLLRYRAGRARSVVARHRPGRAATPRSTVAGGGGVTLRDVDDRRRTARLDLDERASRAPQDQLATALHSLLDLALGPLGLCRVDAVAAVGDRALAAAYAAAGLRHEGTLRDHRDTSGRRGDHELWAATGPPEPDPRH